MSMPYIVYGTITDSNDVAVSGATVWLRNETTNEKIYGTTDSNGKYQFDAANLASGYLNTDNFTVYCNNENEYKDASYLFSSDTHNVDLNLEVIEDSELIYYCTVQDVWDELDKTSTDISAHKIVKAIQRAESEINEQTGGAYASTTITNEYYDWNTETSYKSQEHRETVRILDRHDYFNQCFNDTIKLNHCPIISITSLHINSAGENATDSWTLLTEQTGSSGDFILYKTEGLVKFVNTTPRFGKRSIKVTYNYGKSIVPKIVERLCIILASRNVILGRLAGSQFGVANTISVDGLTVEGGGGGSSGYMNMLDREIDRLWSKVGAMKSEVV